MLKNWTQEDRIPSEKCIKGRVYEIFSRNLHFGIYDGHQGFIGIREKFYSYFLFTEYHFEKPQFGTVGAMRDTGIDVPANLSLNETLGTVNKDNGRPMMNDNTVPNPNPRMEGHMGWWRYTDGDKEVAPTVEQGCHAVSVPNEALFQFLEAIEKQHGLTHPPRIEPPTPWESEEPEDD